MQQLSIFLSIFISAALAYFISDYYAMTPQPFFFIVLVALGLFIQTVIFILQFDDGEEAERKAKEAKR